MSVLKKLLPLFLLIPLLLLSLCACSTCSTCCATTPKTCCADSASKCGFVYDQAALAKLRCQGIQVIQVGDDVKVVLFSDCLFEDQTSVIDPAAYPALNQVATFLCCLEKLNVKVAGYTDGCGCALRNQALSRQQAQAVANYLRRVGIDARVLYAVGYGGYYPIACDNTCKGRSLNRRIEITLRRITDYYEY